MKKFIKLKLIVAGVLASLTLSSCLLDDEVTDFGDGPVVVQFENTAITSNFLQTDANTVYAYEIPIVILGGDGQAIKRDVEISISTNAASTATEGVEFNFASGKTFTLRAGMTSVNAQIEVLSENLDALDPKTLVLQIDSSSETVSDNNKTEIVLQAICPSELGGDYTYANGVTRDVTITSTGPGTYTVSADNAFTGEYSFNMSDVCGNLTITTGTLNSFGIDISGTGTVDPATGTITLSYTVDGYFTDRPMILEKQ